jgi:response regulator NasT
LQVHARRGGAGPRGGREDFIVAATDIDLTTTLSSAEAARLPELPATILVADDEHLVASGIAANLTELGFQVIGPASGGEEAVRLCRTIKPDMALLDVRMPGLDGLAAASVIFQQLSIPVVILSAYSDEQYVDEAQEVGVFGYLLKPVTQDQLRAAITVSWARFRDHALQAVEIQALKQRLEDRKVIEQAKWILVKRKGVEEPEAMRLLQRQARSTRRTLPDVARAIVENEELLG